MENSTDIAINVDGSATSVTLGNDKIPVERDVSCADIVCSIGRNSINRQKVYYTVCIYATFITMGCFVGQLGPSLLDIQSITGVGLEKGSWIVTSFYIGYIVGALLNGVLFHRSKIAVMFAIGLLLRCSGILSIPFCSIFGVTATMSSGIGFFEGLLDTAGNADVMRVWKEKSRVSLMFLHLCFYFGGVISPLYTAPFLMKSDNDIHNRSTNQSGVNFTFAHEAYVNESTSALLSYSIVVSDNNVSQNVQSLFFVPFAITTVFTAIVAGMFFVQILCSDVIYAVMQKGSGDPRKKNETDIPKVLKITGIASLWGVMTISNGMTNAFTSYLSTFCVGTLKWTKANGSFATSLFNVFIVVGTLSGIPLSKCLTNTMYAGINCCLTMLSFIILLISAKTEFSIGVWVSSALFGYGKSVTIAVVMSWVNEKFTVFTGKMSSLFFLGGTIGSALNALFVAFLMDTFSGMWFCYLFLIENLIMIVLCLTASIITRYIYRRYPLTRTDVLL